LSVFYLTVGSVWRDSWGSCFSRAGYVTEKRVFKDTVRVACSVVEQRIRRREQEEQWKREEKRKFSERNKWAAAS
jgi:uncharacterized protein (UPF0218 family)